MPPGYTWYSPDRSSVARPRGRKGNVYRLYGAAVPIRVSAPKKFEEYLKEYELSQNRKVTDIENKALKKEWKRGRKQKRALLLFAPGNPTNPELSHLKAVGAGFVGAQVLIDQVGKDAAASESMRASVQGSQKIMKVQAEEIHKLQDTIAEQAGVIEFLQRQLAQAKISVEIPSTLVSKPTIPTFVEEETKAKKRRLGLTAWVLLSLAGWIVFAVGLGTYFTGIQKGVYDMGVLTLGIFGFIAGIGGLFAHIRKREKEAEREFIEKEKPPPTMPPTPSTEKVITESEEFRP